VKSGGEFSNIYPIVVAKAGAVAPKITLKDKVANLSTKVTLFGSGIAKTNTITTTMGIISNVAPSGKDSITFSFSQAPGLSFYQNIPEEYRTSTDVMIRVTNENGTSNMVGPITLNLTP
jgi:hypothetical protein